ncbi:MAG: MIP/aquaporin family protein [Gemmatimonadaceae bacterium]
MRDALRHFTAEFIGTFALVFVGGGALIAARRPGSNIGLVEVALAHGIILAVMVTATMRVSGHFNPAVTAGFALTRRIGPAMAGIYIAAQLLGAMLAAYALKGLVPPELFDAARGGGQAVASDISFNQAIVLELIATFFLVFVIFGTAVDPKAPQVGGFAIGLTIAADILAIGPFTGASMNPARSLGPAVASGIWEGHAIYWIGPLLGGIAAALLYEYLFIRRGVEPVDHGPIEPVAPRK